MRMLKRGLCLESVIRRGGVGRWFSGVAGFESLEGLVSSQWSSLRNRMDLSSLSQVGGLMHDKGEQRTFESANATEAAEAFLTELRSKLSDLSLEQLSAAIEVARVLNNSRNRPPNYTALLRLIDSPPFLDAFETAIAQAPATPATLSALLSVSRICRDMRFDRRIHQAVIAALRRMPKDGATARRIFELTNSFTQMGDVTAAQAFDGFLGEWRDTLISVAEKEAILSPDELQLAFFGLLNLQRTGSREDTAITGKLIHTLLRQVNDIPQEDLFTLVKHLLNFAPLQVEASTTEDLSALINATLERLRGVAANNADLIRVYYYDLVFRGRIQDPEALQKLLVREPLREQHGMTRNIVQYLKAGGQFLYQRINQEHDNLLENFHERLCEVAYTRMMTASQRPNKSEASQRGSLDISAPLEILGIEFQKDVCAEAFLFDYYLSNFAEWAIREGESNPGAATLAEFFRKNPDIKVVIEIGTRNSFDPHNRRPNFYQRFRKQLCRRSGFFPLIIKDATFGFILRSNESASALREALLREATGVARMFERRPKKHMDKGNSSEARAEQNN